jgi:hypothetical protein
MIQRIDPNIAHARVDPIIGAQPIRPVMPTAQQLSAAAGPVPTVTQPLQSRFIDQLVFTILGSPSGGLSAERRQEQEQGRAEAGNLAASAANGNLGEQFMSTPSGGGGSALESIGKIVSLFGGGGGG